MTENEIAAESKVVAENFIRQFVNPNFKMADLPADKLKENDERFAKEMESYNKLLETGIVNKLLEM